MGDDGQATARSLPAAEPPVQRRLRLARRPDSTSRREALSPQARMRAVMGRFATGVTVLTAGNGATSHGMTANAVSSVSLDPPMALCCVARAARMHEVIMSAQSFAVSILDADQQDLAGYFADWRRPDGQAQFDPVAWRAGPRTGSPLLVGALATVECELVKAYPGGDHTIFLGEVLSARLESGEADGARSDDPDALVFFGGAYHRIRKTA